jgi:chlorobactene glucosyltransferase
MYEILIFCLIYLVFTSIVLIRNLFDFGILRSAENKIIENPSVSICIPARNEENVIEKCVQSAIDQNYKNLEILILDDNSDDSTPHIVRKMIRDFPDRMIRLIQGSERPKDWMGKNWACHQLSNESTGKYLLFIDSDTWLKNNFVSRLVNQINMNNLDAVTVWPQQVLHSFWEKVVVPQVYFVIHTLLPVRYVSKDPRWIPATIRPKIRKYFAAACGQCLAFSRGTYTDIGGHMAVRDKVVEDVELARLLRHHNKSFAMYHGIDAIYCRMYQNKEEIFNGFRKNFLAGFGNNIPLFLMSGILHMVVYILPIIFLVIAMAEKNFTLFYLSLSVISFYTLQRLLVDILNKWDPTYSLLHFLGVIWFQILAIIVLFDKILKRSVKWKDREVKS